MGGKKVHQNWVGNLFDSSVVRMPDGSEWEIRDKLSEKATFAPGRSEQPWSEAQAVYNCQQVKGKSVGMEAIAKIRLQVPPDYPASLDPRVRRKLASRELTGWTKGEINTLRYLNEKGCTVTPKLLFAVQTWQDLDYMPVPGGHLTYLIMEKAPGVPLVNFWEYDRAKRDRIRAAFKKSAQELFSHHARPIDAHLGNIIYDEKKNKCSIVDYEQVLIDLKCPPKKFSNNAYFIWGLALDRDDKEVY
ncbi:hypothetical protein FQN49_003417 [Arthroderma sp. PD_2]|nr:hypothetical protein FQN49_003417 [Arthroderma sp. PD_2]